jgi:hypothetical protein
MTDAASKNADEKTTRERLADSLNEDLHCEYQACGMRETYRSASRTCPRRAKARAYHDQAGANL